jgi:Ser/Thr protein kinase RdoA (MazF antagonist)
MDGAAEALARYGIEAAAVPLTGGTSSAVWRVESPSGRMLLRRHEAAASRQEYLRSELLWISVVSAAGIPAPAPVPLPDGSMGSIQTGVGGRQWSLLAWVPGDHLERLPDRAEAMAIGEVLGRCHAVSALWSPPPWFARPRYDAAWFMRQWARLVAVFPDLVEDEAGAVNQVAVARACAALASLEAMPGEAGLIHADPHDGNLVFARSPLRAGLIDFARCGVGCHALDVAMAQHYVDEDAWAPVVDGYRAVMPLSAAAEAALPALRLLALVDNLATLSDIPGEREGMAADLDDLRRQADALA